MHIHHAEAEGKEGGVGLHVDLGATAHILVVGHPAKIPQILTPSLKSLIKP